MSDTSAADAVAIPITPVSASADGRRNTYSCRCDVVEQVMNYAACQWRQGVLAAPDIKTPADWSPCAQAARANTCNAITMRREEEIAGKAIYFRERNSIAVSASRWGEVSWGALKKVVKAVVAPAVEVAKKPAHVLDSIGDTGDYAEALSAARALPPADLPPTPVVPSTPPPPTALSGESPLAMARRLHAAKLAGAA